MRLASRIKRAIEEVPAVGARLDPYGSQGEEAARKEKGRA
jgi:hypothetical protein